MSIAEKSVTEKPRAALATNRLGVPSVIFFVMSAATPLTVVAGVVTTGYAVTGRTGIPFAFLVIGVVLGLFSVGFVTMAPRVANAGAFYTYISQGLGRPFGVAGAWVALLAYNALQVGLYGAIGAAAAPLLQSWFGLQAAWWVIALVAWALVAALGLLRVELNGKVLAVLLVTEVAVIVVYSLVDLAHPAQGVLTADTLAPANLFGPGVGAILALGVLGFVGFESSVVYSEEARNPGRTIRVATYLSVALIAFLYAFGSWAMSVATGPDRIVDASRSQSTELIFNLAGAHLGEVAVAIGHALFVTSVLAAMISFHNTIARYMFALGRERVLPAALAETSRRTGSPVRSSLLQSGIGLIVIIVYAVAGLDPLVQLFFWLGTSGGLGVLLLITATSFAVIVFLGRHGTGESRWRRTVAPMLAAAAVTVVLALAVANFGTLLGVAPTSPLRWAIPCIYLVVAVLGVAWGLLLRRPQPSLVAQP